MRSPVKKLTRRRAKRRLRGARAGDVGRGAQETVRQAARHGRGRADAGRAQPVGDIRLAGGNATRERYLSDRQNACGG